jgi:hypothetical protein
MRLGLGFLLRVVLVILAVLALVIAVWLVLLPSRILYYSQLGPSVSASVELLVIAVLFVSVSAWIRFGDEVKDWEKPLLLLGILGGLLLALCIGFVTSTATIDEPPDLYSPTLLNNLAATTDYMLIIAAILFAAILGFTMIPRRKSILEWMKNV